VNQLMPYISSPLLWSVLSGALGILLMLPLGNRRTRPLGALLAAFGLGLLAWWLPWMGDGTERALFWILAGLTTIAAIATISSRNPVYCAIWFALTLLTTAGLLLLQGALLLGMATVAVYAGAILVMFLFVLMLAQPKGEAIYDRLGWGTFPAILAVLACVSIVGGLAYTLRQIQIDPPNVASQTAPGSVMTEHHMATLGAELFSKYLVGVEVAGTLLLVALVGAVVIAIQGKQHQVPEPSGRLSTSKGGQGDG